MIKRERTLTTIFSEIKRYSSHNIVFQNDNITPRPFSARSSAHIELSGVSMASAKEYGGECYARDVACLQVQETSEEREAWHDTGTSAPSSTRNSQVCALSPVVELRGRSPRGPGPHERPCCPRKTSDLRGNKGASKRPHKVTHQSMIVTYRSKHRCWCSLLPEMWLLRTLKFSIGSLSLAIVYGPLISYAIVVRQLTETDRSIQLGRPLLMTRGKRLTEFSFQYLKPSLGWPWL